MMLWKYGHCRYCAVNPCRVECDLIQSMVLGFYFLSEARNFLIYSRCTTLYNANKFWPNLLYFRKNIIWYSERTLTFWRRKDGTTNMCCDKQTNGSYYKDISMDNGLQNWRTNAATHIQLHTQTTQANLNERRFRQQTVKTFIWPNKL